MLDRLLIVCWHNVEGTPSSPVADGRGRAGFAEQLELLRRVGNVVALEDGLRRLAAGTLGPRAIALTFDDGYRDNLEVAAPMLAAHGLPATVFLVPDFLSGARQPWWERLAWALGDARGTHVEWEGRRWAVGHEALHRGTYLELTTALKVLDQAAREAAVDELVAQAMPTGRDPSPALMLDWDGARRLADHGIGAGGHASSHAVLARERPDAQHADLARCRRELTGGLDVDVETLAYPNGRFEDFTPDTVVAARDAGFRWAATGVDGWNSAATPPYELRRIFVRPASGVRGLAWALKRWSRPRDRLRRAVGRSPTLVYPSPLR